MMVVRYITKTELGPLSINNHHSDLIQQTAEQEIDRSICQISKQRIGLCA